MRYFLDTEFSNRGPKHPIELISIGIVAEDGREFYACNSEFKARQANDWVRSNVLPHLPDKHPIPPPWGSPRRWMESEAWLRPAGILASLWGFIGDDPAPEFWGYYSHFDFVLVQQLFGDFEHWPDGWPMYCNDLRAWLDWEALNHIEQPDDAPHNALEDARWIAQTFREWSR